MNGFTKCSTCAWSGEVLELDRFGAKHPSAEVIQCQISMLLRAARNIRSCTQYKRKKDKPE